MEQFCSYKALPSGLPSGVVGLLSAQENKTTVLSKKSNLFITIYTDSQYIVNAVQEKWLDNWVRTQFKGGKKNKDLWLQYHQLAQAHHIQFKWIKGHADSIHNNRCDILATTAADKKHLLIDKGYEQEIILSKKLLL